MVVNELKNLVPKVVKDAVGKSTKKNTEGCRDKPAKCLRQILLDGVIIIGLYSLLTHIVDGVAPDFDKMAGFLALWTSIMFLLKSLDLEQSDQFARVAFWTIATKVFGILTVT